MKMALYTNLSVALEKETKKKLYELKKQKKIKYISDFVRDAIEAKLKEVQNNEQRNC